MVWNMKDRKISLFSDTGSLYTRWASSLNLDSHILRVLDSKFSLDVRGVFYTPLVTKKVAWK